MIEKKNRDKRYLSHWRPISLINADVKVGSKAIAKRLEKLLPYAIHSNQYFKGRTVFDAVRTTADLKDFTKSAILIEDICIDFQKEFDTVSRVLMFRTLASLALGQGLFNRFMLFMTMFLLVS